MAWNKNTTPGYETALEDLKNDTMPSAVVLHGREDYLIRWMTGQIVSSYVEESVKMFDYADFDSMSLDSAQPVIDACEMLPVMSRRKVVRVSDIGSKHPALKDLTEYVKNVPDTTILLFTMPDVSAAGKAFNDAVSSAGKIYDFSKLQPKTLRAFVRKYLKKGGVSFTPDIVELIIDISGYYDKDSDYTLDNLRSDIEKISLYASGSQVTAEDVEDIVLGNEEKYVFALTDAVNKGHKSDAIKILNSILSHGGDEFKLLGLLCSQYEIMMLMQESAEHRVNRSYLAGTLKINSRRMNMLSGPASRYTSRELKQILLKAYDIDRNVKLGVMDAKLGLEMFIAGI